MITNTVQIHDNKTFAELYNGETRQEASVKYKKTYAHTHTQTSKTRIVKTHPIFQTVSGKNPKKKKIVRSGVHWLLLYLSDVVGSIE